MAIISPIILPCKHSPLHRRCYAVKADFQLSTEKEIIKLQGASPADVDKAVAAARRAFEGPWSQLAAVDRGAFLYKIAELIDRDRELIAAIDAYDNGKVQYPSSHANIVS